MVKPRLYFDTFVFSGIFDIEFKKETEKLFVMVRRREIICEYSDLTELENAPENVKEHFLNLSGDYTEFIKITQQVEDLAREYIAEKVVGQTCLDDCRHIAPATINKADCLVSCFSAGRRGTLNIS